MLNKSYLKLEIKLNIFVFISPAEDFFGHSVSVFFISAKNAGVV